MRGGSVKNSIGKALALAVGAPRRCAATDAVNDAIAKTLALVGFAGVLAAALAGCGGSGSTGLGPAGAADSVILTRVRTEHVCIEVAAIEYCPIGLTTADGVVVEMGPDEPPVHGPGPQPTTEPCTADGSPCRDGDPVFVLVGTAPGSGCAVAARPAGSAGRWQLGPWTALKASGLEQTFALPEALHATRPEIVLLCFGPEREPSSVPAAVERLADADPKIAFVPAEPP